MRAAYRNAARIAGEEGVEPRGLGLAFNDAGDVVFEETPANMRTLDYIKRGLDDVLERYRDPTTGRLVLDNTGRAIDQTRRALLDELDNINPDYAKARAAWAGPSQNLDRSEERRGGTECVSTCRSRL